MCTFSISLLTQYTLSLAHNIYIKYIYVFGYINTFILYIYLSIDKKYIRVVSSFQTATNSHIYTIWKHHLEQSISLIYLLVMWKLSTCWAVGCRLLFNQTSQYRINIERRAFEPDINTITFQLHCHWKLNFHSWVCVYECTSLHFTFWLLVVRDDVDAAPQTKC